MSPEAMIPGATSDMRKPATGCLRRLKCITRHVSLGRSLPGGERVIPVGVVEAVARSRKWLAGSFPQRTSHPSATEI